MNQNEEKTLPLEQRDIDLLKEQYGKDFLDVIWRAISQTMLIAIVIFAVILLIEIIIFIANFNEKTGEERVEMMTDMLVLNLFVTVFGFIVFFLMQIPRQIASYFSMQSVIAKNAKRRITGRASLGDFMGDDGTYSAYWEVKTDAGTYNFSTLNCKDGDVAQVDFVKVGKETVVLASEPIPLPDAAAYIKRGNSAFQAKNFKAAVADFTQAINLDPRNAIAYHNRGSARYCLGEYNEAIADFTKALELNPKDAEAYSHRAGAKFQSKDYNGAIADYIKATELDPSLNSAYYFICRSYSLLGQKEKALQYLQKALETGYDDFESLASNVDLNNIRALPLFEKLVDEFKAKRAKS
ncbi:MAG: tetratricopeptide repeat protein [Chloroherpetonaceae bacterium]|nr:tetratricopeptide repeat protein [Chloroherpetonaceae bacterium]MDW8436900.1 tetratricopeptide repeat protein [Chloroherpetonaceae bacterium]